MLEIYTAGFLDADGSVSLMRDSKHQPEYIRGPCVEFFNCDEAILKAIQEKWGGSIKARAQKNQKHNVSYELRLIGNNAYNLLKDVAPYMRHQKKGHRARLIVDHYKECTPRNGKYTNEQIEMKIWLVDQVMGTIMRGPGAYSAFDGADTGIDRRVKGRRSQWVRHASG